MRTWPVSIFALLTLSLPAAARTLVVRPDRMGDAPTIQAAIDSLSRGEPGDSPDTILALPGAYAETLTVRPPDRGPDVLLIGAGGASATTLQKVAALPERLGRWITFQGFTVTDTVNLDRQAKWFRWERCVFGSGLRAGFEGSWTPGIAFNRCVFLGDPRVEFYGNASDTLFADCVFTGARLVLEVRQANATLNDCIFEGPATAGLDLGIVNEYSCILNRPVFRNLDRGIRVRHLSHRLHVDQGVFTDIRGAAISVARSSSWEPYVFITHSRFERCDTAIVTRFVERLTLVADTIRDIRGPGVVARAGIILVNGVVVEGCQGAGMTLIPSETDFHPPKGLAPAAEVTGSTFRDCSGPGLVIDPVSSDPPDRIAVLANRFQGNGRHGLDLRGRSVRCLDNVSIGNHGDGIVVEQLPNEQGGDSIVQNTCVDNAGWGISVIALGTAAGMPRSSTTIANNLVAWNGSGLVVHGSGAEPRANDSWRNRELAYAGFEPDASNLTLDPGCCDPVGSDFHVTARSPCSPSGTHGRIGALGVGCDRVRVGVRTLAAEGHGHARPTSRGRLQLAVLGSKYLPAGDMDEESIVWNGVPPTERGAGGAHRRDVDHDGEDDLVLQFIRADALEGGLLTGATRDGTPFQGEVGLNAEWTLVARRGLAAPASESASQARWSIEQIVPNPTLGNEVEVHCSRALPHPLRAVVFDVAGRRVLGTELRAGVSSFRLRLPPGTPRGSYWLVLGQGDATARVRFVVH